LPCGVSPKGFWRKTNWVLSFLNSSTIPQPSQVAASGHCALRL
jgi:hypothetical protein